MKGKTSYGLIITIIIALVFVVAVLGYFIYINPDIETGLLGNFFDALSWFTRPVV